MQQDYNRYPYTIEDCVFKHKKKKFKWIEGYIGTLHFSYVNESDIYQIVKQHSHWIDRINPQKMYMMTAIIRDMLNMDDDANAYNRLTNLRWKFFKWNGKKAWTGIDFWDNA